MNSDILAAEMLKTFEDIKGHKNQIAVEKLAERNIISGKKKAGTDQCDKPVSFWRLFTDRLTVDQFNRF